LDSKKNRVYSKQLVLVGGGHSHALLIRMLAENPLDGVKVVLVSDVYHAPYSGMLPGYLSGFFNYDESHIDLYRLATWSGAEFVHACVDGIDPKKKRVFIKNRPPISYDVLSIDIGSTPKIDNVPGAETFATRVKPVPKFLEVFDSMVEKMESGKLFQKSVVIVGGGTAGVEVALGLRNRISLEHEIHLVQKGQDILIERALRVRKKFRAILSKCGVKLHLGAPVSCVDKDEIHIGDGRLKYDFLYWMTDASAARWLTSSGLELDDHGFILVKDTLQTTIYDDIFASGDVATVVEHPRPKAGVFAVRQAKPLARNIRLLFEGGQTKPFKPQRQFLALVGTGDGRAVALRGPLSISGGWVWRWKVYIDRKFMRQFVELPYSKPIICKKETCIYSQKQLIAATRPTESVTTLTEKMSLQSSNFYLPMVQDPYVFAQIAINDRINEIVAQGGRPVSVSIDMYLPKSLVAVATSLRSSLLEGAKRGLGEFGADLKVGHITEASELGIGITIHGSLGEGRMFSKGGMKQGDVLILTKSLGSGVILTAAKQCRAKGRWLESAIANMLIPGIKASEIAMRFKAGACAHVSGLGLMGHLGEMLEASSLLGNQLTVRLKFSEIPLLSGVADCLHAGIEAEQGVKNSAILDASFKITHEKKSQNLFSVLFDPQTSGGLLFSVDQNQSSEVLAELHRAGDITSAVIGFVENRQDVQILVD